MGYTLLLIYIPPILDKLAEEKLDETSSLDSGENKGAPERHLRNGPVARMVSVIGMAVLMALAMRKDSSAQTLPEAQDIVRRGEEALTRGNFDEGLNLFLSCANCDISILEHLANRLNEWGRTRTGNLILGGRCSDAQNFCRHLFDAKLENCNDEFTEPGYGSWCPPPYSKRARPFRRVAQATAREARQVAQQRQREHDAENRRRIGAGLPTLEQEAIQTAQREREICVINANNERDRCMLTVDDCRGILVAIYHVEDQRLEKKHIGVT